MGSGGLKERGPGQFVAAMWNHAPRMWERTQAERGAYSVLRNEEMAHLFAYLYAAQYIDAPGDPKQGQALFQTKGCARCHAGERPGPGTAPNRSALANLGTPFAWVRAMWNHEITSGPGEERPTFEGQEMSDLLAYVRSEGAASKEEAELLRADPDRGRVLFRAKSCAACHSVKDEAGRKGPELGPGRELPSTVAQLAGSMWNHSPAMWRAMEEEGLRRPRFDDLEMADLVAFLYSFRYVEPGGSGRVGEALFAGRGCGRCHGPRAQGSSLAPSLRGRGKNFTSVALAAALWRHGPEMYEKARSLGLAWPALAASDVGDLMTFLNTTPEGN